MRINAVFLALTTALGVGSAHGQSVFLFETPRLFAPPHGVIAVAVDDLDGDGDQDVIVPELGNPDGSGGFSVFRNTAGSFACGSCLFKPGL